LDTIHKELGIWFQIDPSKSKWIEKESLLEYDVISYDPVQILKLSELDAKLNAIRKAHPKQFELIRLEFKLDRDPVMMHLCCTHRYSIQKRSRDHHELLCSLGPTDIDEEEECSTPSAKRQRISLTESRQLKESEYRKAKLEQIVRRHSGDDHERLQPFLPLVDQLAWLQRHLTPVDVSIDFIVKGSTIRILRATGYRTLTHSQMTIFTCFAEQTLRKQYPRAKVETELECKTKTLVISCFLE